MSSLRLSAAVIASAAAVVLSALPAQADPSSTPDADDIVGVGSDTTQFLLNDLANGYNATSPTPVRKLASFDAVHPTSGAVHDTITARTGVSITRPNGSSEGIVELTKVGSTVDFARSSRAEKSSDDTTSSPNTVFIPFAVDELRWMVNTDAGVPLTLTAADLRDIYTCASTNWVDFGGANKTIVPLVPQAGSGTRSTLQTLVGGTFGTCVSDQSGTVQEHSTAPVKATSGSIAPISSARFVATTGVAKGNISDAATTGYDRTLYNVVRGGAGDTIPTYLQPVFGTGAKDTGWICSTAGKTAITNAGWKVYANCGLKALDA